MFDLSAIKSGYQCQIDGEIITLSAPKLGALKTIMTLASQNGDIDAIANAIALILNNNNSGKKFTAEFVVDNFDLKTATAFLNDFFDWIKDEKKI
jgi:hypothetical protein